MMRRTLVGLLRLESALLRSARLILARWYAHLFGGGPSLSFPPPPLPHGLDEEASMWEAARDANSRRFASGHPPLPAGVRRPPPPPR